MKKILVTGANGMLGQDLCPMFRKAGYSVIKTDIDSLDITDEQSVREVLGSNKPDLIIHCAAFTQVDKAEEVTELAMKINVQGTQNIAQVASQLDATLVYLSTDYVFDGKGKQNYYQIAKQTRLINMDFQN
jgi:dTDP-4-dehydrorhamnose reductase